MHIELEYNGKTYIGKTTDERVEDVAESFNDNIADMNSMRMYLANGRRIVIGKEVLQQGQARSTAFGNLFPSF